MMKTICLSSLVELNKFRRELLSNRNWSPAFDSRMVDLLVDYFQRVRLAHLTSLEQMYLLALADTLANASNESLSSQTYAGQRPSSKTRLNSIESQHTGFSCRYDGWLWFTVSDRRATLCLSITNNEPSEYPRHCTVETYYHECFVCLGIPLGSARGSVGHASMHDEKQAELEWIATVRRGLVDTKQKCHHPTVRKGKWRSQIRSLLTSFHSL